ncbi:hypothetical protein AcW1_008708 [Taiwanofungus camphoratus]|nr:hypothetical protein AcV7_003810 [Antrodia cinnamomea]KAI0948984.1 hypothetical protein AcW1_008708 [Antrodia cinnamomea]
MQSPTCTRMRVRDVRDAEIILHAVALRRLPMVLRRLDDEERMALTSGCVYVWEERSSSPLEASGQEIQRFTEGRSWGPSRARDDFLLYYEKESTGRSSLIQRNSVTGLSQLIKQTYSVFVDSPKNSRKWHINAYYTQDTLDQLNTVDQIPQLKSIQVPAGLYVCARTNTARRMSRILARPSAERRSSDTTSSSSSRGLDVPPSTQSIAVGSLPLPFPGAAGFNTPAPYARQLAPLEYLQNIPPQARDPIDDEVLRSFPSNF